MRQSRKDSFQHLYETAEAQQGFFTTKQAKAAGFAENTHPYHVQAGNWTREHRGIYRLALFPQTDHPDLAIWSLWSRNRREETEGVYSHQTALSLHELSDVNPAKLHMTVPPQFRRNSEIPSILILHHGIVPPQDLQTAQGFQFTRPLRTIMDVAEAGTVERAFVRQAVQQALDRGLIKRSDLRKANLSDPVKKLFEEVLKRVA
jgi:predicted transcriptional regulator of viral defense system